MAVKYEAKIYGKNLDELNTRLIKFLKGKKKLLKGRHIDTIVDEGKNLFLAIIRIDEEGIIDNFRNHYNLLDKRDKDRFLRKLGRFLEVNT